MFQWRQLIWGFGGRAARSCALVLKFDSEFWICFTSSLERSWLFGRSTDRQCYWIDIDHTLEQVLVYLKTLLLLYVIHSCSLTPLLSCETAEKLVFLNHINLYTFGSTSKPSLLYRMGCTLSISTSSLQPRNFMNPLWLRYNFGRPSSMLSFGGLGVPSSSSSSDTLKQFTIKILFIWETG